MTETADAIRARVWDAAPNATGLDAAADIRALRSEDALIADESAARRTQAASRSEADNGAGARLLRQVGVT